MFEIPAGLLSWFYGLTSSYALAIALIAVVLMAVITPLTLKSTKGMLEMQRLAPELRRLQQEHRNDRQKLNEETMKLYQEHKVNPLSSCLPLLAQMPIFIIMFRILHGLTYRPIGASKTISHAVLSAVGQQRAELGFLPRYISHDSNLFQSLVGQHEMRSIGLDLSISPLEALSEGFGTGLIYVLLVVGLGGLYFLQQRMIAARAMVSPTMSPAQQKLMQYLPVAFAVFQVFFLTGLVIYYAAQAVLRIGQQAYITRRFYGHDESLGRQAQRAGERARELAKSDGGGGLLAQARRDLAGGGGRGKQANENKDAKPAATTPAVSSRTTSKRTTAPKNRPTPSGNRPSGRPAANRPGGGRGKKKKR
ncbi:MAG: YidC/Oxa1 family membrane protein insertase [Desertimonas sp.]